MLIRYYEAALSVYYRGIAGCTGCQSKCLKGLDVGELSRCLNYVRGYGSEGLAFENHCYLPHTTRIENFSNSDT